MKLRPLLSIFSSPSAGGESPTKPPSKLQAISDSGSKTSDTTTTTTTTTSYSQHNINNHHKEFSTGNLKILPASDVKLLAVHNHHLYAATGNLIHVINTSSYTILDTFSVAGSSSGSVKSVAFSNGNIYTSHQDHKIRVWKVTESKQHKRIATLPTLEDRLLRSVLPKNYVNVRRHRKKLWIEHHDAVTGLAFISDQLICSISWDKYLKIWRTSDLRCVESIKAHDDAINAVVVASDGTIFTGSGDRLVKVWAVSGNRSDQRLKHRGKAFRKYGLIATLEKHKSAVNALALNDDGSVLFSGGCDRAVLVWEKVHGCNGKVLTGVLRGHCQAILCLINISDLLFSGSADRTVRVWQRGGEGGFFCLKVVDGYDRPVRSLVVDQGEATLSSDANFESNKRVFSESTNGAIRLITFKSLIIGKMFSL